MGGDYHAESAGEATVAGRVCKRLKIRQNGDLAGSRFVFQSSDSIFQQEFSGDASFLFRNNYQLGEITKTGLSIDDWKVIDIDTLQFNNLPVRRFVLEKTTEFHDLVEIYDRFGPVPGFFGNWCGVPCDYNYYRVCSYEDTTFPKVNVPGGDCSFLVPTFEPETGSLALFPNPTDGTLQIALPASDGKLQIRVFDQSGKLVMQEDAPEATTDLSLQAGSLPVGVYWLQVVGQGRVFAEKFCKN